jgi:hypothetical protein
MLFTTVAASFLPRKEAAEAQSTESSHTTMRDAEDVASIYDRWGVDAPSGRMNKHDLMKKMEQAKMEQVAGGSRELFGGNSLLQAPQMTSSQPRSPLGAPPRRVRKQPTRILNTMAPCKGCAAWIDKTTSGRKSGDLVTETPTSRSEKCANMNLSVGLVQALQDSPRVSMEDLRVSYRHEHATKRDELLHALVAEGLIACLPKTLAAERKLVQLSDTASVNTSLGTVDYFSNDGFPDDHQMFTPPDSDASDASDAGDASDCELYSNAERMISPQRNLFTIGAVTKTPPPRERAGIPFRALAGGSRGRYDDYNEGGEANGEENWRTVAAVADDQYGWTHKKETFDSDWGKQFSENATNSEYDGESRRHKLDWHSTTDRPHQQQGDQRAGFRV